MSALDDLIARLQATEGAYPAYLPETSWMFGPNKNYGQEPNSVPTPTASSGWGALTPGNIDLNHRPLVHNPDGSASTVYSMGIDLDPEHDPGGKDVLIPKVSDDGRIMGDQEAINEYKRTGRHMGIYSSPKTSDMAAEAIHEAQAKNPPKTTIETNSNWDLAKFPSGPTEEDEANGPKRWLGPMPPFE